MNENEIAKEIVDAAYHVHRELGPGLLESVYEVILAHELKKRGLKVERQVPVAIVFDGIKFDEGFRADLIIEDKVIAELKSVEKVMPVYPVKYLEGSRCTIHMFYKARRMISFTLVLRKTSS